MEPERDMIKESENIELGSEVESSQGEPQVFYFGFYLLKSKILILVYFCFVFEGVNFKITIKIGSIYLLFEFSKSYNFRVIFST